MDEQASGRPWIQGEGGEWSVAGPDGPIDLCVRGANLVGAVRGERIGGALVRRRRRPDPRGRFTALRSATPDIASPVPVSIDGQLTDVPPPAGGFPFAATVTAAATGLVGSVFFSPLFAVLAGVSALAVVGRWCGAVLSRRRSERRRNRELEVLRGRWVEAVEQWVEAEQRVRCQRAFLPGDVADLVLGDASPWWRRLSGRERLSIVVGAGRVEALVPLADGTELVDGCDPGTSLADVPIAVSLDPGVAVCGDRADVVAAARWLIGSTLTQVGPADLGLILVTTSDRIADWDALKWSPSLVGCVVIDEGGEDGVADVLEQASGGDRDPRPTLVVVDGAEPSGPGALARVLSGRIDDTVSIWLGGDEEVPAGCRARLVVRGDGSGELERFELGRGATSRLRWFGLDETRWSELMRWTGSFDDPEAPSVDGGLRSAAAMADLVDVGDAAVVQRCWLAASTARLRCQLGLGREGPVEIDLVADGPHALVAGTTGSGKSELLRTLVVGLAAEQPPDVVSFVLVDFKGGGAFDLVAPLPHVAAVVTDLDPAEAGRALRGLRAEILDREHRLREMEISDVSEIDRDHPRAFGRLVVIVDEFAALSDELPEFLDGLVDIARRGRSLGVHLVLATQRPSGVVSGQIRANSNLRICLRVQDRADSIDVIDDPVAGQLPAIPGRAVVRRSGGTIEHVQVAQVSGQTAAPCAEVFRLHPDVPVPPGVARVVASWNEELARCSVVVGTAQHSLVEQIAAAGVALSRATPPWVDVPELVSFPVDDPDASSTQATLGILDDPDRRLLRPFRWSTASDGLLVVGASEQQIAGTAVTAVAAALEVRPLPTYVLDGERSGSVALRGLAVLDPVIDVIGVDEPERLVRAVEFLERCSEPRQVVVHQWAALADVLTDAAGPLGVERLAKLVRRAGTCDSLVVVTARSDRDVPQRAAASLGARIVHRLADPSGFLSFGVRPVDGASLEGASFIDPSTGLLGVVAGVSDASLAALAERCMRDPTMLGPAPIRVLGERVERSALPGVRSVDGDWCVPVGLDVDLAPFWVTVGERRPVVVIGQPGAGRTTAITTISSELGNGICVLDDTDRLTDAEVAAAIAEARGAGRPIVVGCTPSAAKRFGSAISELMATATVMLLNPGRSDGDLVRLAVPDLSGQPVGRAVAVDRGRATVVQIAA